MEATVVKQETEKVERKVEQLNQINFKEADFVRATHAATIPINTLPEDLLDPAYWAHVANQLKPWGKVEARSIDGTWYAEYLVLDVGRTWAKVHMLSKHNLTSADVSLTQANAQTAYEVRWRGASKWSVIRRSDNAIMAEMMDKETAQTWLDNHLKANR